MVRLAAGPKLVVVLALLHIHHKFHGPAVDYLGLAAAAFASWSFVPGPGEPVLIAEAIFAAKHDLDIASVIAVAWGGAAVGGMVGWLVGLKAGRALVTARGPLHGLRLAAVQRGEAIFERHTYLAIYLAPSWVAGIHRVRPLTFVLVTLITAAGWASVIGLGAYYAGPPIVDLVADLGLATGIALAVLVIGSLAAEFVRRRRARARQPEG